eukprot:768725-Hanusia_phi.AAC.3
MNGCVGLDLNTNSSASQKPAMAHRKRVCVSRAAVLLFFLVSSSWILPCACLIAPAVFRQTFALRSPEPKQSGPPPFVIHSVKQKPEFATLDKRTSSEVHEVTDVLSFDMLKEFNRREFLQSLGAVLFFVIGTSLGFFLKVPKNRESDGASKRTAVATKRETDGLEKSLEEDMEKMRRMKKDVEDMSESLSEDKQGKDSDPLPPFVPLASVVGLLSFQFVYFRRMLMLDVNKASEADSTFTELLLYRLDYFLSSSPYAKLTLLLNITILAILAGSLLLVLFQGEDFGTALWESWTFVANPGTQANVENPSERVIALSITVAGLLVFAVMIGIITETVSEKVDEFKKGKNRILARDHVLILGFSEKCLDVIEQLAMAMESEGGGEIVVLADKPKEEMEESLSKAMSDPWNLKLRGSQFKKDEGRQEEDVVYQHCKQTADIVLHQVSFRSGNPHYGSELEKVRIEHAKSILVLAGDEQDVSEADSDALRTVMRR